jgi:hypothetical protein
MGRFKDAVKAMKKFRDRVTHEVPTGPHTDVRRRKINPSVLDKSIESGRTKERKRKGKVMGMGVKNVLKRMVGQKEGGRIGLREGTKPLETAMHKKRAEQTKNVKKLTTSDDAYSPEKRQIKIFKKNRKDSGGRGMVKMTTDWSNLKDETSKAKKYFTKKVGRPTSVQVLGPKDFEKRRRRKYNIGGRTRLLEELGRVEAEPSNRNRRAEISRVHGELNRGYKKGGRSGYGSGGAVLKGKKVGIQIK